MGGTSSLSIALAWASGDSVPPASSSTTDRLVARYRHLAAWCTKDGYNRAATEPDVTACGRSVVMYQRTGVGWPIAYLATKDCPVCSVELVALVLREEASREDREP